MAKQARSLRRHPSKLEVTGSNPGTRNWKFRGEEGQELVCRFGPLFLLKFSVELQKF